VTNQQARTTDPGRVFVTSIPAGVAVYQEIEVTDDIQEWKALYNFHCSPFHPFIKAVVGCIWAHRDWESLTACPSQTTIAEECNLSRRTVTKYVGIIARLGLATPLTIGATQLKADYPALAKYAKSSHRYTVYRFDLSNEIWSQRWTKDELAAKEKEAVQLNSRHRRAFRVDGRGRFAGSNSATASAINSATVSAVNSANGSAETFYFLSGADEQVVTTRKSLDGARSSSGRAASSQVEGPAELTIEELLESFNND
jgi:hypothetical protein